MGTNHFRWHYWVRAKQKTIYEVLVVLRLTNTEKKSGCWKSCWFVWAEIISSWYPFVYRIQSKLEIQLDTSWKLRRVKESIQDKWTSISIVYFSVYRPLTALCNTCHIHPFILWWQRLPCKVPTAHQEQFVGSVSCSRMLRYASGGVMDSNQTWPALSPELQPPP